MGGLQVRLEARDFQQLVYGDARDMACCCNIFERTSRAKSASFSEELLQKPFAKQYLIPTLHFRFAQTKSEFDGHLAESGTLLD